MSGRTVSGASYSAAQMRTIAVALELFGDHGVSATSLQMVADGLGVTKAAVYHQFRTKDEIVLAATDVELGQLLASLEAAEAATSPDDAREQLLADVIDLAVRRRRWVRILQSDPVVIRVLGEHPPFQAFLDRLYGLLLGDDPATDLRVRLALVSTSLGTVVTHPLVAGLDDDTLCDELLRIMRDLMDVTAADTPRRDPRR